MVQDLRISPGGRQVGHARWLSDISNKLITSNLGEFFSKIKYLVGRPHNEVMAFAEHAQLCWE
jgi:hypothetical protein